MDFKVTGKLGRYYLAEQYQKNAAGKSDSVSFAEPAAAKKKRCEEYARLNEESAMKRKLMEQEVDKRYYKTSTTKEAVSIAAYESAGILK